jgi:hypothetical protein
VVRSGVTTSSETTPAANSRRNRNFDDMMT